MTTKEKQPCPTCGKEFERLWQHRCRAVTSASPCDARRQQNPERNSCSQTGNCIRAGNAVNMDTKKKQPCPTCGKEFERLGAHKCHAAASTSPTDAGTQRTPAQNSCSQTGSGTPAGNLAKRDAKKTQPCPTCGKEFERLGAHKCSAAASKSPTDAGIQRPPAQNSCSEKGSGTPAGHVANPVTKKTQPCPTCGKEFERLGAHKCHAAASKSPNDARRQQTPARKSAGETNSGTPSGNGAKSDTKKTEPSPTRGKESERLGQYKCPATDSNTPTSARSKNRRPSDDPSHGGTVTHVSKAKTTSQKNYAGNPAVDTLLGNTPTSQLDEETLPKEPSNPSAGLVHGGARPKERCVQSPSSGPSRPTPQSAQRKPHAGSDPQKGKKACKVAYMPPTPPESINTTPDRSPPPSPSTPGQDAKGYKPVIDTSALENVAEEVMAACGLQASGNPTSETNKFFDDEVKLEQAEKDTVSESFNPFRNQIISALQQSTDCSTWNFLNSGSSYDGTKVTRADEVDCMFMPHLPKAWLRINRENAPPGFCFVEMTSAVPRDTVFVRNLCDDKTGCLSSQKFREMTFTIFKMAVDNNRRARVDPNVKAGSPSFPVLLAAIPRQDGGGLEDVSIDLVPALGFSGFLAEWEGNLRHLPKKDVDSIKAGYHAIPKECPLDQYRQASHLLWRLSFSQAEKTLTKFADRRESIASGEDQDPKRSPRTYRKIVLRILKRFLEIFKGVDNSKTSSHNFKVEQLRKAVRYLREQRGYGDLKIEKFTTFQIRTLMWTEFYMTYPNLCHWTADFRRPRLIQSLNQLKKMVSGRMRVPHFLMPDLDIMAEVPKREREFLYIMFHITKELF